MGDILSDFKKRITEAEESLQDLEKASNIPHVGPRTGMEFQTSRDSYKRIYLEKSIQNLKNDAWKLVELAEIDSDNKFFVLQVLIGTEKFKKDMPAAELKKVLAEIIKYTGSLQSGKTIEHDISFIKAEKLPEDIGEDIAADLNEIRKCFVAGAYRSCVVLCGRVMETALHRKYYEVAGQDLLETAPNIGLGNLIAKLKEKNVKIDPGLTQQIHLINQVRVFSVHSKKEAFYPSKEQAQAVILFTLDVLRKLFE